MNWRSFLPGIFAECYHWRERALKAEAQLGDVVRQFATAQLAERERFEAKLEAKEQQLSDLLAGKSSQMPPLPADGDRLNFGEPVPSISPISRRIQEVKEQQAKDIPDEIVELAVEEYLKATAVN